MRARVLALTVLLAGALAAAPAPAAAQTTASVPAPGQLGPWDVGRTTFAVTDPARDDRPLLVDVWYPVDEADAQGATPSFYALIEGTDIGIVSDVALDGPPVSEAGPFPLVVFSHGSGGIRFQSFFLTENLASHGFVVIAADHTGNTALDALGGTSDPFVQVAVDRPLDVTFLITLMQERNRDPADSFYRRLDGDVAVAGHSFGGFTALASAAGFLSAPPDPRVDAIVPIAPASSPFSDEALASIRIPTMIIGGTLDTSTPIDPNSSRAYDLISSPTRYRVDVIDAAHNSFTEICAIYGALVDAGLPPEIIAFVQGLYDDGCTPELIPIEEAHRVTNLYAVSFLRRVLAEDRGYALYLRPAYAETQPVVFFKARGQAIAA